MKPTIPAVITARRPTIIGVATMEFIPTSRSIRPAIILPIQPKPRRNLAVSARRIAWPITSRPTWTSVLPRARVLRFQLSAGQTATCKARTRVLSRKAPAAAASSLIWTPGVTRFQAVSPLIITGSSSVTPRVRLMGSVLCWRRTTLGIIWRGCATRSTGMSPSMLTAS